MEHAAGYTAVAPQPLSSAVYQQLQHKILSRQLAPGTALPSERALSETLGVNRGAVREAVKRLQQAGLVSVRQGGNHRVLNYLEEGGMELLPNLLVDANGKLRASVVRSIMAMRSTLAPDIAASAAQRGGEPLAARLEAITGAMQASTDDLPRLQQLAWDFWRALVAACGNVAYRLAFNSMNKTYDQVRDLLTPVLAAEFRDLDNLRAISNAVRTCDPEAARAAAQRHCGIGRAAMERALGAALHTGEAEG